MSFSSLRRRRARRPAACRRAGPAARGRLAAGRPLPVPLGVFPRSVRSRPPAGAPRSSGGCSTIQRDQDSGDLDATLTPLTDDRRPRAGPGRRRCGQVRTDDHRGKPPRRYTIAFSACWAWRILRRPGRYRAVWPGNAVKRRAFVRQAARATVRSEQDSSERSVVRPVTYGGWFPGRRAGRHVRRRGGVRVSCRVPRRAGWRGRREHGELRIGRAEPAAAPDDHGGAGRRARVRAGWLRPGPRPPGHRPMRRHARAGIGPFRTDRATKSHARVVGSLHRSHGNRPRCRAAPARDAGSFTLVSPRPSGWPRRRTRDPHAATAP